MAINYRDAYGIFLELLRIVEPSSDEEDYVFEHICLWLATRPNRIVSWVAGLAFITEFHSTLDDHVVTLYPRYNPWLSWPRGEGTSTEEYESDSSDSSESHVDSSLESSHGTFVGW